MNYFVYILFRIAVFKAYLMPFSILYVISDVFAFFLNKVFKYRRKIVYDNLKLCFPHYNNHEIKTVADKFYKNLSDIIVEALKGFSMSEKELNRRFDFKEKDILEKFYKNGRNVICVSAHFDNWEWGVLIMGRQYKNKPFGVYKPLSNKYIDDYIEKKRKKLGMSLLKMEDTVNMMRLQRDEPSVFILIADQSPSSHKKALWVDFFNVKTACSPGAEVSAKLFDMPVFYIIPNRIKRGFYNVNWTLISENPKETSKGEIIQKYFSLLENDIKNKPESWLWSHRRWKHKYEEIFK